MSHNADDLKLGFFRLWRRRFHLCILRAYFKMMRKTTDTFWTDEEFEEMLNEAQAEYIKEFNL